MYEYGLPNAQSTVHPSCHAQLPNVAGMPQLDLNFRRAASETGEGTNSDGELHSTHTTPMNYMRRSTPTAQAKKTDLLQHNMTVHENNFLEHSEKDSYDLHYSLSADEYTHLDSRDPAQPVLNGGLGDNVSEATAEPFASFRGPDNRILDTATNGANLSLSMLRLGSENDSVDSVTGGLQGLSFQSKLNETQRSQWSAPEQQLQSSQSQQSQLQQGEGGFPPLGQGDPYARQRQPLPRANASNGYRPGYSSQYSIGENYDLLGGVPPAPYPETGHSASASPASLLMPNQPGSRRSTPNSTPTHAQYVASRAAQQGPQGSSGLLPRHTDHLPSAPQQHQQSAYGSNYGSAQLDFNAPVTGMAALAMDSLDSLSDPRGTGASSQRTPTHASYQQPPQQLQGYATASRYGEVVAGPRTPTAYGQQVPQLQQHQQSLYQDQHAYIPQHQHQQLGYGGAAPQPAYGHHAVGGAGMLGVPGNLIYQVQFKRGCRSFTLAQRANFAVKERDFVVVEADRGEDVGVVVEVLDMQTFMERRMNMPRPSPQQQQDGEDQNVCCILRLATLHERQMLPDKFHTEKDIVQSCNELATYGFGLPITVFDAELQFDRRKLTIYYDCSVRIDFRDFVRQLYATYKARIWMKKVSPHIAPDVQPFAAMALATGVQFSHSAGMGMGMGGGMGGY